MAKYPALLFYPGDWLGGTMGMSFEAKGVYMDLLMMQFNVGHMTSDMIGHAVGQRWDMIKHKFKKDEAGLFFNERLDEEQKKRIAYVESRKNNKKGSNQHSKNLKNQGHMTSHMENENEDVKRNNISFEKSEKLFFELTKSELQNSIEYLDRVAQKKFTDEQIKNTWLGFKVQYESDFYVNRVKVIQHFRDWLKKQNHATTKKPSTGDLTFDKC